LSVFFRLFNQNPLCILLVFQSCCIARPFQPPFSDRAFYDYRLIHS
jgi:hypothetical protein